MTQRVEPGPTKAELHYRSAQQYHELARTVSNTPDSPVERNILVASSGALLYEAAKQCLNAVANLRGRDPKGNQEKLSEINSIAADWHWVAPKSAFDAKVAWLMQKGCWRSLQSERETDGHDQAKTSPSKIRRDLY